METECFGESATSESLEGKAFLQAYKSILNSKATEDSLVSILCSYIYTYPVPRGEVLQTSSSKVVKMMQCDIIPKTAVQLCQMGAWSWKIQFQTPMEPIPEDWSSFSPVRFFHGGYGFLSLMTVSWSQSWAVLQSTNSMQWDELTLCSGTQRALGSTSNNDRTIYNLHVCSHQSCQNTQERAIRG